MRYQFQIEGHRAAPARETINEAALDALDLGYAYPDEQGRIVLHDHANIVTLSPLPN